MFFVLALLIFYHTALFILFYMLDRVLQNLRKLLEQLVVVLHLNLMSLPSTVCKQKEKRKKLTLALVVLKDTRRESVSGSD